MRAEVAAPSGEGGSEAELRYARALPGRIEAYAEGLARERGLDRGGMGARDAVLLLREAAGRFAEYEARVSAPSREALRAGLFIEDRIIAVLETGARVTGTARELFRLPGVRTGVLRVLAAAEAAKDLAGMAAAAEAAAESVAAIVEKHAISAANIAGAFTLEPAAGGRERGKAG